MCQMSHVTCQVSGIRCQVSGIMWNFFLSFFGGEGANDGAIQWRVCYQWGLLRLVFEVFKELDGVVLLITDLPPTRSTKFSDLKVFYDTWHLTCDTQYTGSGEPRWAPVSPGYTGSDVKWHNKTYNVVLANPLTATETKHISPIQLSINKKVKGEITIKKSEKS